MTLTSDFKTPDPLLKLCRYMAVDAILITDLKNIRYFTGFTGSSGLCLYTRAGRRFFISDFRYKEQSEREVKDWEIIIDKNRLIALRKLLKKLDIKKIAFEPSISFETLENIKRLDLKTYTLKKALLRLREIKRPDEIERIKEAVRRAEEAFLKIKPLIKPGIVERDIQIELEYQLKKLGSGILPFEPIVASGGNSALPHGRATTKKIAPGDLVVIDWGAEAEGYYSDMTRTFLIKSSNDDQSIEEKKRIYEIVRQAQHEALVSVKPGLTTKEIDSRARQFIQRHGYGKAFGHSTGHGVGLDIHELPSISATTAEKLKPGMVFTVEPGIYISGLGGVRIEDMVVVRDEGSEILTSLPKDLEEIQV